MCKATTYFVGRSQERRRQQDFDGLGADPKPRPRNAAERHPDPPDTHTSCMEEIAVFSDWRRTSAFGPAGLCQSVRIIASRAPSIRPLSTSLRASERAPGYRVRLCVFTGCAAERPPAAFWPTALETHGGDKSAVVVSPLALHPLQQRVVPGLAATQIVRVGGRRRGCGGKGESVRQSSHEAVAAEVVGPLPVPAAPQ
jgi:hypothetical protein